MAAHFIRVHCEALFAADAFFIGGPGRVTAVGWVCRCEEHVIPIQSDLRFTFAIGDESFEVIEFALQEGGSETFLLEVDLASANPPIDFGAVLDRATLLTLWHGDTPVPYVHGAVSAFAQRDTGFRRSRYSAIVEPRLARLELSSDWRIFQSQSVPQITDAVLKADGLNQGYEQRSTTEPGARILPAGRRHRLSLRRAHHAGGRFFLFLPPYRRGPKAHKPSWERTTATSG